jgi:two-component system response regulator YesN
MARILIVDDDEDIVDLVEGMLTPEHQVVGVTDTREALETLRQTNIDLLVTDIRMPRENGFILIQQAKKLNPNLRVIIISAYYDETDEIARQIVHQYAPIALSKPLTRATVTEAVAAALPS